MVKKEVRPKIKLELTGIDRFLKLTGWFLFIMLWVFTIMIYHSLPEKIPTHFNFYGKPDNYGSKAMIFFLPVMGTIIFLLMTILNRFPHIFNYPVKITLENASRQYLLATRLIHSMNIVVILIFLAIIVFTHQTSLSNLTGLGLLFLPLVFLLTSVPVIIYFVKAGKKK